jgi:hypothetical protein
MPTNIPVFPPIMPAYSPAANAMGMQMLFSSDFFPVALFSMMGLLSRWSLPSTVNRASGSEPPVKRRSMSAFGADIAI